MRSNEEVLERIAVLTLLAEDVTESLLKDPATPAGVRQRAAAMVLEYGWPGRVDELRVSAGVGIRAVLEATEIVKLREWVRTHRDRLPNPYKALADHPGLFPSSSKVPGADP